MSEADRILEALKQIRYDLSVTQTRVAEVAALVAGLPLPSGDRHPCPACGIEFRGERSVAEHLYNSHGGPVPAHYRAAERAAGLDTDPPEDDWDGNPGTTRALLGSPEVRPKWLRVPDPPESVG